jgi:hypothetical protein
MKIRSETVLDQKTAIHEGFVAVNGGNGITPPSSDSEQVCIIRYSDLKGF